MMYSYSQTGMQSSFNDCIRLQLGFWNITPGHENTEAAPGADPGERRLGDSHVETWLKAIERRQFSDSRAYAPREATGRGEGRRSASDVK